MKQLGRWALIACTALGLLTLGACSSMPWSKKEDKAAGQVAAPLRDMYHLKVEAPSNLKPLLTSFLDLARFQNGPESDRITSAELDRLVAGAPAQARSLAETRGYFNSQVSARREAAGSDGLPNVIVEMTAGPQTVIQSVELKTKGHVEEAAQAQDAAALDTIQQLREKWPLEPGKPFSQSAWDGAKGDGLAVLRVDGYPAASWASTSAQVDADENSARLYGLADSGPLFHFGEVKVAGLQRYKAEAVSNLMTFKRGERYSEKALLDSQDRLQRSGLFEGAVVSIEPDPSKADAVPVTAQVRESPLQQATVGVGYADSTGERITLEHTHRRVFGRSFFGTDWIAKNKFNLGRDTQSWQGDLTSHPLAGGWHNLVGAGLQSEQAAGTTVKSARLRVGRSVETESMDRLIFLELLHASTDNSVSSETSQAVSGNYNWVWRDLDNALLPTRGLAATLETAGGYAWSNNADNGVFSRVRSRVTAFRPIGDNWFGQARLELGQIFAASAVGIPDTLLFRAGGDDSVRGYAYRSLGPTQSGVVVSGRTLMTASGEIARPISRDLPSVWWALFADAGNAADNWGDLKLVLGYGAGVRWRSPVGPLRIDLAYADELRKFRVHFSVGVAF